MTIRPIDIARKLKISTSALRHYESWGFLPPIERGPNGYRVYTEEHVAYFACIRSMYPAYGMGVTGDSLRLIQQGRVNDALWLLNGQQARLHRDKEIAEKTVRALEAIEDDRLELVSRKTGLTIGEASKETAIPESALRHWEKEGLLVPDRDPDNGYRVYARVHVRQALMIRTLRTAGYYLDAIRPILRELGDNRLEQARRIAQDSLDNLGTVLRHQLRGARDLHTLCVLLGLVGD